MSPDMGRWGAGGLSRERHGRARAPGPADRRGLSRAPAAAVWVWGDTSTSERRPGLSHVVTPLGPSLPVRGRRPPAGLSEFDVSSAVFEQLPGCQEAARLEVASRGGSRYEGHVICPQAGAGQALSARPEPAGRPSPGGSWAPGPAAGRGADWRSVASLRSGHLAWRSGR